MNDFKNINTLLFDLNGTLINTEKEFYMSFYEVLLNKYKIKIAKVDEYTLVKFCDTRCIEFNSVDDFAKKILNV